jgi:hypothetical protein
MDDRQSGISDSKDRKADESTGKRKVDFETFCQLPVQRETHGECDISFYSPAPLCVQNSESHRILDAVAYRRRGDFALILPMSKSIRV